MGRWSEWHYSTREIGGWIHIITSPSHLFDCLLLALCYDGCSGVLNRVRARAAVARAAIIVAGSSKCVNDIMLKLKMKSWTVTRVFMWLVCDHGVEASKDWVFVAHFIHFSTPRCRYRAQTYTPEPRCHTSYTGGLVRAVKLRISGRGPTVFKLSHIQACLQNVKPMYNTFNAPALWNTSQVWVSSAARQERPSMFFNFIKITLVNICILNWVLCSF